MLRPALAPLVAAALAATMSACGEEGTAPGEFQNGMNLTAFQPEVLASPAGAKSLSSLNAIAVTHVAFVPTEYQDGKTSTTIEPDPAKTPSEASLLDSMARAKELGMKVVLKPAVDARDNTFRGEFEPGDRAAWFTSYTAMIDRYADLAARGGADMLVVGVELTSLSGEEQRWREIIKRVRERFKGDLSFAANWNDGLERVKFWDDLDYIGVDAYYPLANKPSPSLQELIDGWEEPKKKIEAVHDQFKKPVLFPEIGYENLAGTATRPFGGAEGPVDEQAQARAYEAAYRVWKDVDWFAGLYWWQWSSTEGDDPYDPAGRPAEDVIRTQGGSR